MTDAPVLILVNPQMGENIGAACRAMLNGGLTELRLVAPRDGWPSESATRVAAGALDALTVKLFDTTAEAVADLQRVYASTARPRDVVLPVVTCARAAQELRGLAAAGQRTGVLFGPERAGLANGDLAFADTIVTVPLNPGFTSLNLAQAVLLVAYEWFQAGDDTQPTLLPPTVGDPATVAQVEHLVSHLEESLDSVQFFPTAEKKPPIMRNLRAMLHRLSPTAQEVRTIHGMLTSMTGRRRDGRTR